MFRSVSRFARMLILTLVAVWLPVTLHCRLEAAGFYDAADDCCSTEQAAAPAGDCKDDACPTVEDALYKESAHSLKVAAPDVSLCLACLALVPESAANEPALSTASHAPPLEIEAAWQFLARAAPPARAPSLNT
jgi:hypothetical protein